MNIFDIFLVQPVFNVLVVIYGLIPGRDFGIALIVFTVLIRLLMWPLVKRQLRQTKVMRDLQPELVKIKARTKGNRQQEAAAMMELYKEKGVSPFGSIGLLLVQLPIFITLFAVVRLITQDTANIAKYTYDILEKIPAVADAIHGDFDESLLGIIDLTKAASAPGAELYVPLILLAIIAAVLQFVQSKQLMPEPKEKRRLRDILKDQALGKQADQSEISALMTSKMIWLFPIVTFFVSIYLAGALVLYLAVQSSVAIIQQSRALRTDETDLEKLSEKTKQKVAKAKPAEVVASKKKSKKKRRK